MKTKSAEKTTLRQKSKQKQIKQQNQPTQKTTAKLSNNPQVQKRAAYLTKAEIALKSEDYTAATENYNRAVKTKLPSNVDKSDADTLNAWAAEIYARLQYQNIITFRKKIPVCGLS